MSSTVRSTAAASGPGSSSFSSRHSGPAISSSSTISAATRARGPQRHPQRRRPSLVPAGLLPRPQPDRTGLRQDQTLDARRPEAVHRRYLASPRTPHRHHRTPGVPQLHQERRIRSNLKRIRSITGLPAHDRLHSPVAADPTTKSLEGCPSARIPVPQPGV